MYTVLCSSGGMVFHGSDIKNIRVPRPADMKRALLEEHKGNAFVLLEGGADINPSRYGEENRHSYYDSYKDEHEFELFNMALELEIPMLGICRGHQLMNVASGGTLWQDIRTERNEEHRGSHFVRLFNSDDSFQKLMSVYTDVGDRSLAFVNSLHHQGVSKIAPGAVAIAEHRDGLNEALRYPFGISVQWHPELMRHNDFVPFMFEEFVHAKP
jgi:gamma-glutamyl-gamma-aminobutyrate hydrolase PuuD